MLREMSLPTATQDALLSLYRGEASAVEAYDRVLDKFKGQPEAPTLGEIRDEHESARRRLDLELQRNGLKTPESSGGWGVFASALYSVAALVNDEAPLQVLQRGEEVGSADYARAIDADGLEATFVQQLRDDHMQCQAHHERLQQLRDVILNQPTRPMI